MFGLLGWQRGHLAVTRPYGLCESTHKMLRENIFILIGSCVKQRKELHDLREDDVPGCGSGQDRLVA